MPEAFGSIDQPYPFRFGHIIALQLGGLSAETRLSQMLEQRLRPGQKIIALVQHQIETFPDQRDETESRRMRHGAAGDAAIGTA